MMLLVVLLLIVYGTTMGSDLLTTCMDLSLFSETLSNSMMALPALSAFSFERFVQKKPLI